jgi:AcrR family transcriptional regulator
MGRVQEARLLTATLELVHEGGYSSLTVAQIIGRAGVSRKSFYDLFESCEDCFLATVNWGIDLLAPAVIEAYRMQSSWREGIRAALAVLLGSFDAAPAFAQLLVVEALAPRNRARERAEEICGRLAAEIDEGGAGAPTEAHLPLAGEAVVGAVWSILNTRLTRQDTRSLLALHGTLMSVIVLAYLGLDTAREEVSRPAPQTPALPQASLLEPLAATESLNMRLTHRTLLVLAAIGDRPGGSNRDIAQAAGVADAGQISKLLARLRDLGLIRNTGLGQTAGAANDWSLTPNGDGVLRQYWPAAPPG